ncbi:MAG: Rieske (2Fe-2S) protein [Cyclobacteriaceae bacterium]|nr:Rieske (2Fe-2S) protein [Cyclobacteriaceae bacterium]MCH8515341.1 Rieske (2Fe-2S) protein [Cyclobacteriaceae bacterium]
MKVKSGKLSEDRRKFLKDAGSFAVLSMMGIGFFTSCSSDDDPVPVVDNNDVNENDDNGEAAISIQGNTVRINLDLENRLDEAGSWLLISQANVIVINDGGFVALTAVCTHAGCNTSWSFNNQRQLVCGCHGSRFDTEGNVLQGPASRPLEMFETSQDENILTITTS